MCDALYVSIPVLKIPFLLGGFSNALIPFLADSFFKVHTLHTSFIHHMSIDKEAICITATRIPRIPATTFADLLTLSLLFLEMVHQPNPGGVGLIKCQVPPALPHAHVVHLLQPNEVATGLPGVRMNRIEFFSTLGK